MALIETVGGASAAEKIGWLGVIGGFFLTVHKVMRWLVRLEQAAEIAKEERKEMLEEVRGLRKEINHILTMLANRGYYQYRDEE